jgi:hypothetical protein
MTTDLRAKAQEMRAIVATGIEWGADPDLELKALTEILQAVYDLAVQETRQQALSVFYLPDGENAFRCAVCRKGWSLGPNFATGPSHHSPCIVEQLAASLQAGVPQSKTEEK